MYSAAISGASLECGLYCTCSCVGLRIIVAFYWYEMVTLCLCGWVSGTVWVTNVSFCVCVFCVWVQSSTVWMCLASANFNCFHFVFVARQESTTRVKWIYWYVVAFESMDTWVYATTCSQLNVLWPGSYQCYMILVLQLCSATFVIVLSYFLCLMPMIACTYVTDVLFLRSFFLSSLILTGRKPFLSVCLSWKRKTYSKKIFTISPGVSGNSFDCAQIFYMVLFFFGWWG